jgi:hypothetical protein
MEISPPLSTASSVPCRTLRKSVTDLSTSLFVSGFGGFTNAQPGCIRFRVDAIRALKTDEDGGSSSGKVPLGNGVPASGNPKTSPEAPCGDGRTAQ